MDQEFEGQLQKLCATPQGKLKAQFALGELQKVAAAHAFETTRPFAQARLEAWARGDAGELRKGLALNWLATARQALANSSMVRGAAATVRQVDAKVGNVGAAAGQALANSPLNARRMAQVRHAGGTEAQARMADRFSRPAPVRGRVEQMPHQAPRLEASDLQHAPTRAVEAGAAPMPRLEQPANDTHAQALAAAYQAGASSAGSQHAAAAARMGRVAARHGFRAGLAIAGAGAAGAGIHASLSDKQRQQRSEAGKHSHDGHVQKGAPDDGGLKKGLGRAVVAVANHPAGLLAVAGATMVGGAAAMHHAIKSPQFQADLAQQRHEDDARDAAEAASRAPHVKKLAAMHAPKAPKTPGAAR